MAVTRDSVLTVDLAVERVRDLNQRLHAAELPAAVRVVNPMGRHSIAAGIDGACEVEIEGHVGYYCAGMNKHATVRVRGNCGVGVAENMMSGHGRSWKGRPVSRPRATARGGLLVVHGDAAARCAISLKGADVVIRGSIGHMGAFLGQRGHAGGLRRRG